LELPVRSDHDGIRPSAETECSQGEPLDGLMPNCQVRRSASSFLQHLQMRPAKSVR